MNDQVAKTRQPDITDQVGRKLSKLEATGDIHFPKNYSYENALKGALLVLQETKDRNKNLVLNSCSKESIANALLEMCIKGLSVTKKQGYFIAFGSKLTFLESYHGKVAMVKRMIDVKSVSAQVIYEGDEFEYGVNPQTGMKVIHKHEQKLENIDNTKIKGAYAVIVENDGLTHLEIMSFAQIQKAWGQGQTKGNSDAHINFAEEMSKKSVISRLCKNIINTSDDGSLEIPDDEGKDKFDHMKESGQLNPESEVTVELEEEEEVEESLVPETSNYLKGGDDIQPPFGAK